MGLIIFNDEQTLIQNEVKKFVKDKLSPIADEIDKKEKFPEEIITTLTELGLMTIMVPEDYKGAGLDCTSLCIAAEELSKECASIGLVMVVNNCLVGYALSRYGTQFQKTQYLNSLSDGVIGGYGFCPEINNPERLLKSEKKGGNFVLSRGNGFILNGAVAEFILFSNFQEKKFLLFPKQAGLKLKNQYILGMRSAGIVRFEFNQIEVPETSSFSFDNKVFDLAYIGFSAVGLGIARAALDSAIKYAKERKQFGRPICEFPMVQELITKMKIAVETSRLLVYESAKCFDNNEDSSLIANITRVYVTETAVLCGLNAIQVYGGYGYTKDYPVERYLRDAKTLQVLLGQPYLAKSLIAKEILL